MNNLDLECAKAANAIAAELGKDKDAAQELEKLATAGGAVLAENGPYAFYLYLWSRSKRRQKKQDGSEERVRFTPAEKIAEETYRVVAMALALGPVPKPWSWESTLAKMQEVGGNLERLLLAKKLLGQTLTYLRYHAKARGKERGREARITAVGGSR